MTIGDLMDLPEVSDAALDLIDGPIYLASPYWDDRPLVVQERVFRNTSVAEAYVRKGYPVYSPCAYTRQWQGDALDKWAPPCGWYAFDLKFLAGCGAMIILMLPGVEHSTGVSLELRYARGAGIPVFRLEAGQGGFVSS